MAGIAGTDKACEHCGAEFTGRSNRRFCSNACARAFRYPTQSGALGLNFADLGALHELKVCVDLTAQGFHVYRAVSPSAPCDLIAMRTGGRPIRVEVKTGYRLKRGGVRYSAPTNSEWDVVAVVLPDGVLYKPDLGDFLASDS